MKDIRSMDALYMFTILHFVYTMDHVVVMLAFH